MQARESFVIIKIISTSTENEMHTPGLPKLQGTKHMSLLLILLLILMLLLVFQSCMALLLPDFHPAQTAQFLPHVVAVAAGAGAVGG